MTFSKDALGYILLRTIIGVAVVAVITGLICFVIQWQVLLLYGIALQYAGMFTIASGILIMIGQGKFLTMLPSSSGDYSARTQQQIADKQAA